MHKNTHKNAKNCIFDIEHAPASFFDWVTHTHTQRRLPHYSLRVGKELWGRGHGDAGAQLVALAVLAEVRAVGEGR